jgi:hypothetical protein
MCGSFITTTFTPNSQSSLNSATYNGAGSKGIVFTTGMYVDQGDAATREEGPIHILGLGAPFPRHDFGRLAFSSLPLSHLTGGASSPCTSIDTITLQLANYGEIFVDTA